MSSMILEAIIADKKISKIHTRMESGNTFAYQITYAN
jgi:hypothetical protein